MSEQETKDVDPESSPEEENRIPESRVAEMVGKAKDDVRTEMSGQYQGQLDSLRNQLTAVQQTPQGEPEKVWTLPELQALEDSGDLTRDQVLAIALDQQGKAITQQLRAEFQGDMAQQKQSDHLTAEMAKYTDQIPDLNKQGSEARERVAERYAELTKLGQPVGLATEILACREVFGPASRIKETTRETAERHTETGGAGAGPGKSNGSVPDIPDKFKAHYDKLIGMGQYKGWDDPKLKNELKHIRT